MHIKPVMHLKQIIFMAGYQSNALHGAMKELLFSHSVMSDSLQPHGLGHPRLPLSFTISWSLLKPMSIKLVMPSNHLILCFPFLLLPSVFPSIRVFSNELTLHQLAKLLELQIRHHPSNEDSGLISSRIDWLDLADQGTLKNLLQHHSSKASILWPPAFFIVHLSHPYMTTALIRWTFVDKAMSLLFNMYVCLCLCDLLFSR